MMDAQLIIGLVFAGSFIGVAFTLWLTKPERESIQFQKDIKFKDDYERLTLLSEHSFLYNTLFSALPEHFAGDDRFHDLVAWLNEMRIKYVSIKVDMEKKFPERREQT